MPAKLAFLMCTTLAVSEAVQIEVLKLVGIAIAAAGAVWSARIGRENRRELHRFRLEQRRRRAEVRDPDSEQLIVVDHPPNDPEGAHRRASDPPPEEAP